MTYEFPTFAHLPAVRAAAAPHAPAVADDAIDLDNAAFDGAVRSAAAALRAAGIGHGDVVAVKLPNTALLVVTLFASWHLGAAATPINPYLAQPEVEYQVQDAGAAVLVTDADAPAGITVVAADALLAHAPDAAEPAAAPSDLALLIYTSGTTGRPKGVMLDHANLVAMSEMSSAAFDFDADDHSLLILPLFHVNAIVVSTLNPLRGGGRVTIAGRFDPRTFFQVLEETGATYFSAVPTIYTMLAGLPTEVRPDLSRVRFGVCGAAPASRELLEGFEARYGFPLIEGYGLSECTCAATCNPLDGERKVGSVGVPLPGQRIRIAGPDGADVPAGEPGEVLLAGPNIMRGYLGRPEETARTVVDGWLHTGDVGVLDEDGYLRLVDRAKDMIIRGGENIYPKEIETTVYGVAGVAEAAVIGRPDAKYGELPVLYVSAAPGVQLDVQTIAALLVFPVLGNIRPDKVSFLPSLRQYAGNWATGMWAFAPGAEEKLNRVQRQTTNTVDQFVATGVDREWAETLMNMGLGWRAMHSNGRGLFSTLLSHVPDVEQRTLREGELVCNTLIGFNFGDGHLHDETLIAAVQEQAGFEPGELIVVWAESQPITRFSQDFKIIDAALGVVARGRWSVTECVTTQPWLPDGPVACEITWSADHDRFPLGIGLGSRA